MADKRDIWVLDPDIAWYQGQQFPNGKENFGVFLDSMPDTWGKTPAFDINPSIDKNGLALNVDMDNNSLDLELAKSVGIYFRLTDNEMNVIK